MVIRLASKIEWLWMPGYQGEYWNPVTGCTKTSPGCANCYAETFAIRFGRDGGSYLPGKAEINFHQERMGIPFGWRKPRMCFINSVSDLFHDEVTDAQIDAILSVVFRNPRHIFVSLTKRPKRMLEYFGDEPWKQTVRRDTIERAIRREGSLASLKWPIPNLWMGVSVENQHFADERIPLLRKVPTVIRWVSVEPLLGPINFEGHIERHDKDGRDVTGLSGLWDDFDTRSIDWFVTGGESGAGARPMHPLWLSNGIDAADTMAGVPVFFKQWGHYRPYDGGVEDDLDRVVDVRFNKRWAPGDPPDWPMVGVGKGKAGHSMALAGYWEDERHNWPEYGLRYGL